MTLNGDIDYLSQRLMIILFNMTYIYTLNQTNTNHAKIN